MRKFKFPHFLYFQISSTSLLCSLASSLPHLPFTFTLFVVASRKIRCRHRFALSRIHGEGGEEQRMMWGGKQQNKSDYGPPLKVSREKMTEATKNKNVLCVSKFIKNGFSFLPNFTNLRKKARMMCFFSIVDVAVACLELAEDS